MPQSIQILFILLIVVSIQEMLVDSSNSGIEDDIQFLFKWPGPAAQFENDMKQHLETIEIATNNNEKFKCSMPINLDEDELNSQNKQNKEANEQSTGASQLINTNIYSKKFCSYRIESYWIYELCHGQFVKQYHETKTAGKRLVTQEYFLGYFDPNKQEPDYFKQSDGNLIPNIHWKTIRGELVATFAAKYTDGTVCEVLNGIQREITIYYACDENGNDNIAGFEEVSSCIYEMIVVTKWICQHPAYTIPDKLPKEISCYSVDKSPAKPKDLTLLELEQYKLMNERNEIKMTNRKGETFIIHYNKIDEEEETVDVQSPSELETQMENQLNQLNQLNHLNQMNVPTPQNFDTYTPSYPSHVNEEAQRDMIKSLLNGVQCLNGGTGWWKYEICFGQKVVQYHEDEYTKKRTNIFLGHWNLANHLEWLNKYPNKRPLSNINDRTSISVLYSDGDYCEQTNKKRIVEVKFKCLKANSHTVSLYLLEPVTCEYLLTVESSHLCEFVATADLNALPSDSLQSQQQSNDKQKEESVKTTTHEPHLEP